jgi:hypothetical protein
MKQKLYIFGLVTTMVIFTGTIFKVNHWPGAGILLTLGMAIFVLGFLPASLLNLYGREGNKQNKLLFFVTYLTCFVVFIAMLFKIQHWPFAGIALTVALPFPFVVFLPVFLYITGKNKNFNIYNTVSVLFLLALVSVFNALLSLSVTKSRIDDSLNFPRNYNKLEMALSQIRLKGAENRVNILIDDVINVVKEYEEIILKQEDLTVQQWKNNPAILWRPEARSAAANALLESSEAPLASKLSRALTSLIKEMEKTPGYELTAKNLPVILDLGWSNGINPDWVMWYFMDSSLVWSLTYLDSIETNLLMLKISAS